MADLKLIADSGGGTVSLKAPAATTSNAAVTLKLPVADGSANQLLKTDGSGQLGWATDSTGLSSDAQKNTVGGTNAGDSFSGTNAEENTLIGYDAGTDISSGDANTVLGAYAGKDIDTGHSNTFIGRRAGHQNTSGQESVAIGAYSLAEVTTASHNTSIGNMALRFCDAGQYNSCSGQSAGYNITSGSDNVCIGHGAGNSTNWSNSTSLTTGSNNILIGKFAVPSANNVSNEITLGNSSITKFRVPGLNFVIKDSTATDNYVLTVDANGEAGWEVAGGTVADGCIYENSQTISNNYTIASGKGAHSVGPITNNAVVTLNGVWVIS